MKNKLPIIVSIACAVLCVAVIIAAVIFALRPDSADEQTTETAATEPTGDTAADRDNIGFDIFD